ncbi:MAG: UDP-2,3-diacylglucosamine diphosphatase, partial [Chitinophagaceae bacterium]|nr:UDP-2,3-diacylglucosamine diphosphatase [Chitinophagaceae bacterium]
RCGHIHQPEMREMSNNEGSIMYLNSGDWIENLTSLEYHEGEWRIYRYGEEELLNVLTENAEEEEEEFSNNQLFTNLLSELRMIS